MSYSVASPPPPPQPPLHTPMHTHTQTFPPPLFLLPCFFDLLSDCATSDVLFYLMILWIYAWQALVPLVPQGPCGVFYASV